MWIGWKGGKWKQRRGKGRPSSSPWPLVSESVLCYSSYLPTDQKGIWDGRPEKEKPGFPSSAKGREENVKHRRYTPRTLGASQLSVDAPSICMLEGPVLSKLLFLDINGIWNMVPVPVLNETHSLAGLCTPICQA